MKSKRFWGSRSRAPYIAKVKDYIEYTLVAKTELRFEVEDPNNKIFLTVCVSISSGINTILFSCCCLVF